MTEREQTTGPDTDGDPDGETIPADKTADGLDDVQISGEAEENAPSGGPSAATSGGGQP
jgi:hypothetical protein